MTRHILTNGMKSAEIRDSWDFVDALRVGQVAENDLYAKVAAAFTAVNKSARAVAYMPFALVDKRGEDYDVSWEWQNKIGFMPNPRDILRRVRQSLIMSNTAYLLMGVNQLGMPKKLNYIVPTSIRVVTNPATGDLSRLERTVGAGNVQVYEPDDNQLIRLWWLDESTELLPSPNTEFKAIMQAAGIIYYGDYFTRAFYERGGIRPTLIAMKGMVSSETKEDIERGWTKFIKNIGSYARSVSAKLYNADAMSIQPFGDGLGDLAKTPVYRQAMEAIAIGLDMPLSLLLSNSANYATAQTEYVQWYRNSISPWCDFIADTLNEQLFERMGLKMDFRPEQTDPEQEDEVNRTNALTGIGTALGTFPDADTFMGAAGLLGFELTPEFEQAVRAYYATKNAVPPAPEPQPMPQPEPQPQPEPEDTAGDVTEDVAEYGIPTDPVKWMPTIGQYSDLVTWQGVALRKLKRGESLDFDYLPHHSDLPEHVTKTIKAALIQEGIDASGIRMAFESINPIPQIDPTPNDDAIKRLADAINRMVEEREPEAKALEPMPFPQPVINVTMPSITLNAQMPEQSAPAITVNIPEQPVPEVTVNVPEQPAPVNNVIVQPANVVLPPVPMEATITTDARGNRKIKVNK